MLGMVYNTDFTLMKISHAIHHMTLNKLTNPIYTVYMPTYTV